MAQITLPFTLVAGTPENVNNVQSNFVQIKDHINNALIGTDNITDASLLDTDLASPNNTVPRTIFSVGGSSVNAGTAAGTYLLVHGQLVTTLAGASVTPVWIPSTADFAVAGKTTQVRLVAYLLANATGPAVNFTVGLQATSGIAGGAGNMTFTLSAASMTALFSTPGAGLASRVASSWVSLSSLSAVPNVMTVAPSGTTAASSVVSISANVEMRHT